MFDMQVQEHGCSSTTCYRWSMVLIEYCGEESLLDYYERERDREGGGGVREGRRKKLSGASK